MLFRSRFYMDYKDKSNSEVVINKLKKIWENRDITIIEGYLSRLGVGNDLFDKANSIRRILCPSNNAFSKYTEILKESMKENKNRLILIALGPTATVLAYDLYLNGHQAFDLGHADIEYEWYLRKATTPCKIENKYVNESENGTKIGRAHV